VLTTITVVVALCLLGGRPDSKGVAVELALVVHDNIEVTFEKGGRSWWICNIGFTRSFAPPDASIVVVFSVEVMHYRILSVD
jgi:hypothetical protein